MPIIMKAPGFMHEDKHNRYLADEELDALLPSSSSGYAIVTPPPGYAPLVRPPKLSATPVTKVGGFQIQESSDAAAAAATAAEDAQYFTKILKEEDETELSVDEMKERKIMRLLLKIKNAHSGGSRAALAGQSHRPLVRPYVHKILVVIEPLLIDEDYYARVEGREIISNLSKAAGLAHMISTMRPDINHTDEYVRNTTARAFSVVASALGIPLLLPFLKAICRSKKSWQARHTGIRIVQQIAIMMGCAVLPHLCNLVDSALAEAAPYGIESFDNVLKPLWVGIILIREFQTSDEEMKKIILKVVQQIFSPDFFKVFWVRRMALDCRNYRQVVETTVELAQKSGVAEIVGRIVNDLKDEAEPYRKMVMETITKVVASLGASDIDERLEEQTTEDQVMLDGFGTIVNALGMPSTVVNALGIRVKPYLTQIVSTILWRLNNKSAKVRQQAADLITRLAVVIKQCGEDQLLSKLGLMLFEQLGEEYPDTLGSIIATKGAIANVVGMTQMNPPVKDLLPRMTPILRNRHENVQEATINLIGRIADRGTEFVAAREWMRICFELLDLLKAHKKGIRCAAVNSFGYRAWVPKMFFSTVAITIVAETCGPFTCIPAILNEYRTAELNVRTGCLKALSFVFEYIGPQSAYMIVKHLALGVAGLGCEDSMLHLMNLIWPNCFETSLRIIGAVMEAIEAMHVTLSPGVLLSHTLQGLFHPARKVREVYWRIYNSLYLGSADSPVPFYPDLGELSEGQNVYDRHPMQVFI
ncbi:armadillo-type protein [Trametes meyenii]|nr:armadillo-type protein [Trametes meyenii]